MYRPSRVRHTPSAIDASASSYTSVPGPMPLLDTLYRHSALARPVSLVCKDAATVQRRRQTSSVVLSLLHQLYNISSLAEEATCRGFSHECREGVRTRELCSQSEFIYALDCLASILIQN